MFEAFRIGVRLSLINDVSRGLVGMSSQFSKLHGQSTGLQRELDKLKGHTLLGGAMVGAGVGLSIPLIAALDKAAQLQKQMIGIQVATRGTVAEMSNMRSAIEGVASKTVFSNIDVAKISKLIATGTGLGAKDVTALLPGYSKFADVQMLMKGTPFEKSVTDAIRLAHTAQHYDSKSLGSYLDLLTKASFIVPGDLSEVGHALKYSQGIGKTALGIGDEQMVLLTALLNRLGFAGSRGGTNLIAAMTRTIPGVFGSGLLTGKSGEALTAMGMVDHAGHSKFLKNGKFDAFAWMGGMAEYVQREFAKHPEGIARQDIMKNFQHAFGTQGSRVASLLSDPQALQQLRGIGETFSAYGGVDSIQQKFADESVAQQWMNAKTNFESALTEFGYTLLPIASDALKGLNVQLQNSIKWISENQDKAKALAYGMAGLAGALAFGGTVTMLSSAFKGLGMALSLSSMGGLGLGGALGSVASGLTLIGVAVAGMAWILDKLPKPQSKDATPMPNNPNWKFGYKWMTGRSGTGHWEEDHDGLIFKPHAGGWVRDENAQSQFIAPKGSQTTQIHTQINLDGKKIAKAVTEHQEKAASGPRAGTAGFDASRHLMPIGASGTR